MRQLLIASGFIASLFASGLVIVAAIFISNLFDNMFVDCFFGLFVMALSGYAMGAVNNSIWRKAGLKAPVIKRFNFFFSGSLWVLGFLASVVALITSDDMDSAWLFLFIIAFALVIPVLYIPAFFFGQWLALEKPKKTI